MRCYLSKDLKQVREFIRNIRKTRSYSCIHAQRMWNMTESFCGIFYITIKEENEVGQWPRWGTQGQRLRQEWAYWVLLGRALRSKALQRQWRRTGKAGLGFGGFPGGSCQCRRQRVRSLVWKILLAAEQLNLCATTICALKPTSHSYWAVSTREAATAKRALQPRSRSHLPSWNALEQRWPSTTKIINK